MMVSVYQKRMPNKSDPRGEELIKKAAKDIIAARKVIALTGAGISVESRIPPFRGKGGLWEKYDPAEGGIDNFRRNPEKSWKMLKEMLEVILIAKPNPAHQGLARLEELGLLSCIITQNGDGLHQDAGNTDVIEFHGTARWVICMDCGNRYKTVDISLDKLPPKCNCGGVLKIDGVYFGEPIPLNALSRSQKEAEDCDLMLVIGTSAVVYPAATLPLIARQTGAKVIEINPDPTQLTNTISDYLIRGRAGDIMSLLVKEVETLRS